MANLHDDARLQAPPARAYHRVYFAASVSREGYLRLTPSVLREREHAVCVAIHVEPFIDEEGTRGADSIIRTGGHPWPRTDRPIELLNADFADGIRALCPWPVL